MNQDDINTLLNVQATAYEKSFIVNQLKTKTSDPDAKKLLTEIVELLYKVTDNIEILMQ